MKKQIYFFLFYSLIVISCQDDPMPKACFTYQHQMSFINGPIGMVDSVQFTNCSSNADNYLWEFGDGQFSSEASPMHVFSQDLPAIVSLTAMNGSNTDILTDTIWEWAIVYKPNIYLYPKENTNLCVSLDFPKGGTVVKSIPEYKNAWCVQVQTNGKIDNNYDYLFYESAQPNIWQHEKGWCIAQENLQQFFTNDMQKRGFAQNEIDDFITYWIPLLNQTAYYTIYPQEKQTIDQVISLEFSKQPDVIYRLFYVLEAATEQKLLAEPQSSHFERNGFTAVEWGVVLN
jgi:PKD repeat protein